MLFATNGSAALRRKILSVLDEIVFRKVITSKEHKDIKEESKVDWIIYIVIRDGARTTHHADERAEFCILDVEYIQSSKS